jgi:hypothetical protein
MNAIGGMAVGERSEGLGQPVVGVNRAQLAVFDERGDDRPVVAAFVGAGEERVLSVQREVAWRIWIESSASVEIFISYIYQCDTTRHTMHISSLLSRICLNVTSATENNLMNAAGVCNTTSWAAEGVKMTRSTKAVERY